MSRRDEALRNKSGPVKIVQNGAGKFSCGSGESPGILSFQPGFYLLVGYIILSLAVARFIFWSHSWNFSWMPAGQANGFFLLFVAVHLLIGPSCILFCDVIHEIRKIRRRVPCRPLRVFLKDFVNEHITTGYLQKGAIAYCLVYATLIGYTNLKVAIPLLNHNYYDALLFRWDRSLLHILSFGGFITIPKYSTISDFFDVIYFRCGRLRALRLPCLFETVPYSGGIPWRCALHSGFPSRYLFFSPRSALLSGSRDFSRISATQIQPR